MSETETRLDFEFHLTDEQVRAVQHIEEKATSGNVNFAIPCELTLSFSSDETHRIRGRLLQGVYARQVYRALQGILDAAMEE